MRYSTTWLFLPSEPSGAWPSPYPTKTWFPTTAIESGALKVLLPVANTVTSYGGTAFGAEAAGVCPKMGWAIKLDTIRAAGTMTDRPGFFMGFLLDFLRMQ